MSDRIGTLWRDYRTKVIPLDAPAIQATECRRAFYADADALFVILMAVLDPGTEATEHDLETMNEIVEELRAFADAVRQQRA